MLYIRRELNSTEFLNPYIQIVKVARFEQEPITVINTNVMKQNRNIFQRFQLSRHVKNNLKNPSYKIYMNYNFHRVCNASKSQNSQDFS